jgi:hypothetical protein
MFFAYAVRLPSLYTIYFGQPDFGPLVNNVTRQESFVTFSNGNNSKGDSAAFDNWGPIMQQPIIGVCSIGALIRWTEISIDCPFITYLPSCYAGLPISFEIYRRFSQSASPVTVPVFNGNQSRFAIGVGTSSPFRLNYADIGNAGTWLVKFGSDDWRFYNWSNVGNLLNDPVYLRYAPTANQENTIFGLTIPGVTF